MWELDHKEGWVPKNWYFWIMVLDKTLDSPLDYKETKPVNLKGNQPWTLIGRTDAEAEAPILWPPDVKSQLTRKDHDAGKDWRQEEKGTQMVGWPHRLNGHEFARTLGDSEGWGTWRAAVHGVTKSQIQLSDLTTTWIIQIAICFLVKVLSLGHLKLYIKTENVPSRSLSCLVFWLLKSLDCSPLCVFLNKSSLHTRRLSKMTHIWEKKNICILNAYWKY